MRMLSAPCGRFYPTGARRDASNRGARRRDVRFGLRAWRRNPDFAFVAVASLAVDRAPGSRSTACGVQRTIFLGAAPARIARSMALDQTSGPGRVERGDDCRRENSRLLVRHEMTGALHQALVDDLRQQRAIVGGDLDI